MALYSLEVEKHALGGLIQNPQVLADVEPFMGEKDFVSEPHAVIYSCLRNAFLKNEKIDRVMLAQAVKSLGISFKDDIDIFNYVGTISFAPRTSEATLAACQELRKLRELREIDRTCDRIKTHINKSLSLELPTIIHQVDAMYGERMNSFEVQQEPEDLFFQLYEMIEEEGKNPKEELGLLTPYAEFNRFYGGLRGGNVYAIASRPAQGKTTWLNHMACETGRINNVPVLILDTEMTSKEIRYRNAAAFSGVPLWYLETGQWRKHANMVDKVRNTLKNLNQNYKVHHYHVGNKPVDEVCAIIRRWYLSVVGRGNKCIVVYDYLKLTGEKLFQNWAEHQAIGEKIDKFKRISIEFDFPFVTAIQLNRFGENTGRQSNNIVDDGSAISLSDRLQWFATYLGIFRRKTSDEMVLDTLDSGTHKLIEIKGRYQGKDAVGHQDLMLRTFPDGSKKYMRQYINFSIDNFAVKECGSLKDCIARQNAQFLVKDAEKIEQQEETL